MRVPKQNLKLMQAQEDIALKTRLFRSPDGKIQPESLIPISDTQKTSYIQKYQEIDGITVDEAAADFQIS